MLVLLAAGSSPVLADGFVHAVGDAGVRAARLPDLPDGLATVVFPRPDLP
ncbi:MAG TPA: hypothetical protein VEB43_18640 [Anaeromyxobacter sp.]|nr:hypothetical protein [Anaeromyxobacter sp.]